EEALQSQPSGKELNSLLNQ
ncbi:rCG64466, partial [Rattus norvegicus]